jgi:UDP-glucose 4-epimerase
MTPPRTLVTGACGFLGSHVADELVKLGHSVLALDDLSGGRRDNLSPEIDFLQGSVCDTALLADLFSSRIDYVFHLAAYAAEGLSHHIRRHNYLTNLVGSANLINCAINSSVRCFVFTSSIAVYGAAHPPFTEDSPTVPIDPYGIAKLAVELDLRAAHDYHSLPYIVFRPHNVYGERQSLSDPYRNVVAIFMRQALAGQPFTIFGDGSQTRAFTYVGDIAPTIARSVTVPAAYNQTFNIGSEVTATVAELAAIMHDEIPASPGAERLDARHEAPAAFADQSKLWDVFGIQRTTPLADGIRRMADWAVTTFHAKPRPFTGIEVGRNLPPSWRDLLGRQYMHWQTMEAR